MSIETMATLIGLLQYQAQFRQVRNNWFGSDFSETITAEQLLAVEDEIDKRLNDIPVHPEIIAILKNG